MSKKRYDYLDLYKCIAMFMVISLHSGLWHTDFITSKSLISVLEYSIRLIMEGVPIFIFINGFLIVDKSNLDINKHYKKVFKIFILFILWTILDYSIIAIINSEQLSFNSILGNLLNTKIGTKYTGHLWFLQNLISIYLIYPILNALYKYNKKIYNNFLVVVAIFTFVPSLINIIFPSNFISPFINRFNPICNSVFLFYFMFGGFFKDNIEWFIKNKSIIIIVSIILYIFSCLYGIKMSYINNYMFSNNYLYSQGVLLFIIVGLLLIIFKYKNNNKFYNKIIKNISENTLGIYLIHPIIIAFLIKYLNITYYTSFILRLMLCLAVYLLSFSIVLLINKIPKFNKIIKI